MKVDGKNIICVFKWVSYDNSVFKWVMSICNLRLLYMHITY